MITEITFKPTGRAGLYRVYRGHVNLGLVQRVDNWTVRGSSHRWLTIHKGRTVESGALTRREAAERLVGRA